MLVALSCAHGIARQHSCHCCYVYPCSRAAAAGVEDFGADAVQTANVRQLADMGFSAKQALQALEENNHCLDMALEWLAENCI